MVSYMKKPIFLVVPLILILSLNIYFRIFPINFPQLKTPARNIVEQKIREEAKQEIDKRFPEFNALAKEELIEVFISDYKKQNKDKIGKQVQDEYLKLKDRYQDENGQTYLMELDCWHWARYVDNILHLGHPGDKVINGKQVDNLMLAPLGRDFAWNNFLFYFSAFLYKLFSLFKPVPLFNFVFYLPLFFITIFIILLYLFCYYRAGNLVALIACLFVGLAPFFLQRSCAGWFDMDILNLLFPLLVVWTYLIAYNAASFRQKLFWLCFSGFWIGLFCFTWINWWFIFLIILIYETYFLVNLIFVYWQYKEKNLNLFKQHLFSSSLFLFFSFFWIILFSGFVPLVALYEQIKGALILNKPLTDFIWPNVYSTVGELKRADILQIANSIGGVPLFASSLVCMLILFLCTLRSRKYAGIQHQTILIFIFWFISMFFACFRGVRFAMFILIPLGICLGWIINEAYEYFKNKNKKWITLAVVVITIILVSQFINNAYDSAKSTFPLMNDTWYKLLVRIKETTPTNSIINSWWDFGDWFKTVSQRRVIFDGQSQNAPQSYWMGRILMTDNEEEAIGILRMLNNGGNKVFEIINEYLKEPLKSVMLLEKIILSKTPQEAKETLLKFLPSSAGEEIIKLLFNKPDKAYFIVDYTMPSKISSISFLGNWNFAKAYLAQNMHKKKKGQLIAHLVALGMDNQQVQRFLEEAALVSNQDLINGWVSQRLKFYSGWVKGEKKDGLVLFDNSLVYNPNEQNIYLYSFRDGKYKIPKSLFVLKNDELKEIIFPNNDLDFSVLILKAQEEYRVVLLERELANSLLVRLYFLGGAGLKYFKPFIEEKDEDSYIRVFEIMWEKG